MRIGPERAHRRNRALFVTWIRIGIDEKNTDCLATGSQQCVCRVTYLIQIDLGVFATVGQDPLVDLQAQVARDNWLIAAGQAPGLWPVAPTHFQHITKTTSRDHAGLGHAPLQQRIGCHRCTMNDRCQCGCAAANTFNTVNEATSLGATA